MPANAGQTSRFGGLVDNAILISSLSPASLTAPLVDSSDSSDFEAKDLSDWEGFSSSSNSDCLATTKNSSIARDSEASEEAEATGEDSTRASER